MVLLIKTLPICLGRVDDGDGNDFPSAASMEQQDVPSPGEEEDFFLHRHLKEYMKLSHKFFTIERVPYKGGGKLMLEVDRIVVSMVGRI
jgi:hypothetical protein